MPGRLRFSVRSAYHHLRAVDPVVAALIDQHGPYRPRPGGHPYASIVRSILFQQLAGAAARAIQQRFYALYGHDDAPPSPTQILATTDDAFRSAGVSRQKRAYLRDLAEHIVSGALRLEDLDELTDEEIVERLTAVKGVGEWTAHMFLMFELGRPDVLPVGDLGVRQGMRVAYGLSDVPSPARARDIGRPWTPYRSVGAWYMWRAAETLLPDD